MTVFPPVIELPLVALRARFPALSRTHLGQPIVWACAPGGTQVPSSVIEASSFYQRGGMSNLHGAFAASQRADDLVKTARKRAALLLGTEDEETIHFGASATSLVFSLSHAIARTWVRGDVIVVTSLDHASNITPWVRAARDAGVEVRTWNFRTLDGALHLEDLQPLLTGAVRMIAVTAAANSLGTIVPVEAVAQLARKVGALLVVDAVHFAAHRSLNVHEMGCDILTCSAYKFFGPHLGIQWVRRKLADNLDVDKVAPAPNVGGARWEHGALSLESLAGFVGCVDYLLSLGGGANRAALEASFSAIAKHEEILSERFIQRVSDISGLQMYGERSPSTELRTPTFGLAHHTIPSAQLAAFLAQRAVNTWSGHFYAEGVTQRLKLAKQGGLLRIGFAHYHCLEEVTRTADSLKEAVERLG